MSGLNNTRHPDDSILGFKKVVSNATSNRDSLMLNNLDVSDLERIIDQ